MTERLREVADHAPQPRVVLFRQQPHVVTQGQQPFEQLLGLAHPPRQRVVVGEPEGAGQEGALTSGQPVHGTVLGGRVAQYEAVLHELTFDGAHRADDPRIRRGQEADQRHVQQGGVQLGGAVELREGVAVGVEAPDADLVVDLGSQRRPAVQRAGQARLGDALDRPVGRHPGHDLGVDEVPPRPSDLPDALVRLTPSGLQEVHQLGLQGPGVVAAVHLGRHPGHMQRVQYLAVDVELELFDGAVADPYGRRTLVAGQPRHFVLGEPAFTADPVHDLDPGGVTGHRAQQPFPPRGGLAGEAGIEQSEQGDGGVAQPAVAVVPVADATDHLRQGCGDRRDDAAGGGVRQRLEGDQGPPDGLLPLSVVGAAGHPLRPPRLGEIDRPADVDLGGCATV